MASIDQEAGLLSLSPTPSSATDSKPPSKPSKHRDLQNLAIFISGVIIISLLLAHWPFAPSFPPPGPRVAAATTDIAQTWGQYTPYYRVPSEIPPDVPAGCNITFAQLLSRHGSRFPTSTKSALYAQTVARIQRQARRFGGGWESLKRYRYELGRDQLTEFGRGEMVESGREFFKGYAGLGGGGVFMRASGEQRVVESAEMFWEGWGGGKDEIVVVSEGKGINNTLNHGLCPAFEASTVASTAQAVFASTFLPNITTRLRSLLPGANLTNADTLILMDLCPFNTVATPHGTPLSPFCALFTPNEWAQYDYYQTLGKYYGSGPGNPLGPTQGVGFVNELIARLTGEKVVDDTSVNHTLDANPATFPLGRALYADFGHDNGMTAVFSALGLYEQTPVLEKGRVMTEEEMKGYSARRTVMFAARAVWEKMRCAEGEEELVRAVVNGRVVPLQRCGVDRLGRCGLGAFVGSLGFARGGGRWEDCFLDTPRGA